MRFSNVLSKKALVVEPTFDELGNIVSGIPNILLQSSLEIYVSVAMHFKDGKCVIHKETLEVAPEKKPSDYIYTEIEIKNYEELEQRIKALEEQGTGGNGKPGSDGFSPIANVVETTEGAVITITDKKGTTTATVKNGKDGKDGADGAKGEKGDKGDTGAKGTDGTSVAIKNISESTADGGNNVVTFSDGQKMIIKNGTKGSKGDDGYTPQKNKDYYDGKDGQDGKNGTDGKTAYQYAKDGGYIGTEEEFAEKLAQENPTKEEFNKLSKEKADKKDIPTVPIQSVNGKVGAVVLNAEDVGATTQAYVDSEISDLKKQGIQQTPLFANNIEELEASGDKTKLYVLPDGYIYAYMKKYNPAEPLFTNRLPLAIDSDGQLFNGVLGYQEGYRLQSSDGAAVAYAGRCVTGFIEAKKGDTIRTKGITYISDSMQIAYGSSFNKLGTQAYPSTITPVDGVVTFTAEGSSSSIYIRISTGTVAPDAIITVNEPIEYSEPGERYVWANTGHAFVPTDYEERIISLENTAENHESRLAKVEKVIESGDFDDKTDEEKINGFRYWDRAIFDRIPTYTLADEAKDALTTDMRKSESIYQKYDDLMTLANSEMEYVTKTLLGQDEAGYNVYRYDFKMPEQPRLESSPLSKSVPKVIFVSGVHCEWAGVYALYNTMYEITTNPDLIDLKRNVHFIVMPMVNAYGCNTGNRKNFNGIDIARNFEVDFVATTDPSAESYGGVEPLSELESQYVDKVMSENTDAWFFVSCHNYFSGSEEYVHLWGAAATRYFHNLCQKLVDKLSREWGKKYSFMPDNTYLGATEMSAPKGSEGMQALKYGIQGGTLECRSNFPYHSATSYTAFAQSRATEVYINFLLTALGNFEACDKRDLKDYDGVR